MADAVRFKVNKRTVTYTDANGNTSSLTGNRPWRNNNPGNLRFTTDDAAIAAGALGRDAQGFAIFPNYTVGRTAMESWWNTKSVKGYTIEQALKVYAPTSENDTGKYLKEIEAATGVSRTTKMGTLNSNQMKALYDKAQKFEGYDDGAKSGKSNGMKTFYNRDGKAIKLNELDKNLLKDVVLEESTKIAYANDVYTDSSDEVLRSAVRAARKQKTREADRPEEYVTLDGDAEVSKETQNKNADAELSRKRPPANFGTDAPAGFPADPGSPLQRAMAALKLKSDDVHLTPTESDNEHETPNSFDIRNNGTSDIVGSCAMIPGGCEMTAGDKKVVMYQLSGSDVNLER